MMLFNDFFISKLKFISILLCYHLCISSIFAFDEYGSDDYGDIFDSLKQHTKNTFGTYEDYQFDFLKEDDHGDFELEDIISMSGADIGQDIDAYSSMEKMVLVDHHNIYRSNLTKPFPKGSDLEYMEWNDTLAANAYEWLKHCKFQHGYGKHDNITSLQGQNLYMGPSRIPSRPLYMWYQEYKYFDFKSFSCKKPYPKYQCEHMTQMLWSDSSKIGCARKSNCFPLTSFKRMVNCHYFRAGNNWKIGRQMYKYGWPCTRCELPDGNFCYHGLCVDKKMCSAYNLECECELNCKNCAKPNYENCRCESCKSGWDWKDCSFPCIDLYDMHQKKRGFCQWKVQNQTKQLCESSEVSNMCRKACGDCKSLNLKDKKNLCCKGKICPPYHVLDDKCKCVKDCPSNVCLYPPSTTKTPSVKKSETLVPRENIASSADCIFSAEMSLLLLVLSVLLSICLV